MKIEYINQPLIYAECSTLLTKFFYAESHPEDETAVYDPAEYLRGFAQRRQLPFERVKTYAEALNGLYADMAKAAVTIPEETRRFFFTAMREGTNALSATLAIILDKSLRLREIEDIPRRERMRFYIALGTVSDDGYPDNGIDAYNEETFLKCLESCGADAGERWNAWSVYRRTDYYLDLLQETLQPFAEIYRRHLPQIQPLFDETIRLAKQNLAEDPKAALAQNYFVSLDIEELVIRPQATLLLGASMWIMDRSLEVENLFVIGCCFDALRSMWFGSENIVNQLQTQVKALDDKRRFQILTALKERPLCGQEICALTGLSPATVSHHMNELVSARFVSIEKVGTRINYRQRVEVIEEFIENIRQTLL